MPLTSRAMNKAPCLLLPLALLMALPVTAAPDAPSTQASDELVVDGKTVGQRVEARPGETCLVCREPIASNDPVYRVQGQRVAVHSGEHEQTLRGRLSYWLAQIQPRGALFSAERSRSSLSRFWFFAGLYVLLGLIFAGAAAHLAVQKALPPIPWFFLGLFLNAVGYLILLTRAPGDRQSFPAGIPTGLQKVPRTYDSSLCPCCGSPLHPAAHACADCGGDVQPSLESEADRWRKQRLS